MGKGKPNRSPEKKELSEGKAIILSVLVITAGLAGAVYILGLVLNFFFPGLWN